MTTDLTKEKAMIDYEKNTMLATKFLTAMGEPGNVTGNGPAIILKRLNELGMRVSGQRPFGAGIQFFVPEDEAIVMIDKKHKESQKTKSLTQSTDLEMIKSRLDDLEYLCASIRESMVLLCNEFGLKPENKG